MYSDDQYRRQCLRENAGDPNFSGLRTDAPVRRVEDWPDRTYAGAFVLDKLGHSHFILESEIELDLMITERT